MGLIVSGSSGNIPTGSGSERLRRAVLQGNDGTTNNAWHTLLAGTAGHIYTILSVVCAEQQNGSGCTIEMQVDNGTNDTRILSAKSIGNFGTFVWNDKFVLEEDDILEVRNTSTDCDWYVSYIDQDWT